jgi:hypothetical protein
MIDASYKMVHIPKTPPKTTDELGAIMGGTALRIP